MIGLPDLVTNHHYRTMDVFLQSIARYKAEEGLVIEDTRGGNQVDALTTLYVHPSYRTSPYLDWHARIRLSLIASENAFNPCRTRCGDPILIKQVSQGRYEACQNS